MDVALMAKSGLTSRITSGGQFVLRCHYSADDHKNPHTPEGMAWLEQAAGGYKNGLQDPGWRKEYEIEYGAMGGTYLFPDFELEKSWIVVPPISLDQLPNAKLYGSFDYGRTHPS